MIAHVRVPMVVVVVGRKGGGGGGGGVGRLKAQSPLLTIRCICSINYLIFSN